MIPDSLDQLVPCLKERADNAAAEGTATATADAWYFRTAAARIEALEEALTPSGDTKAAYMGEFSVRLPDIGPDGEEYMRSINVPWTTIKAIMAAIRARALTPEPFPQPKRNDGGAPCGECHLQPGETCGICGAARALVQP